MNTQTTPVSEAPFALPKILDESTRGANGSSDARQADDPMPSTGPVTSASGTEDTEQIRTAQRHGRTFTVDGFPNEWEAARRMRALILWHHNLTADASPRPHRTQVRGGPARRPSVRRRARRSGASRSSPDDGPGEPPQDGSGPGGPPSPPSGAPFIITATTKTGEPYTRRPIDFDDFDDFDVWPDDGDHLP